MIDDALHQKLKSASSFIHSTALFMADLSREVEGIFHDCHERKTDDVAAQLEAQIARIEARLEHIDEAQKKVLKPLKSLKKRAKPVLTTLGDALDAMEKEDELLLKSLKKRHQSPEMGSADTSILVA
mgnify:CR=1 FL=1